MKWKDGRWQDKYPVGLRVAVNIPYDEESGYMCKEKHTYHGVVVRPTYLASPYLAVDPSSMGLKWIKGVLLAEEDEITVLEELPSVQEEEWL